MILSDSLPINFLPTQSHPSARSPLSAHAPTHSRPDRVCTAPEESDDKTLPYGDEIEADWDLPPEDFPSDHTQATADKAPTELSDPAFASEAVAHIQSICDSAIEEVKASKEKLYEARKRRENQLDTLGRWKTKANAWQFPELTSAIDIQITAIENNDVAQNKRWGTSRTRANAPYMKALEWISVLLERCSVEYAPDRAVEVLWYSGFSDLANFVDVIHPLRSTTNVRETQGGRNRLRRYEKKKLKAFEDFQTSLPVDHPLKRFFTNFIEQEKMRINLPRKQRGQVAKDRKYKIKQKAYRGEIEK